MDVSLAKFFWDIFKTLKSWSKEETKIKKQNSDEVLTDASPLAVIARLVDLFEQHGVKRSQIAAFFGHGLELKDFVDDQSLLDVITEQQLQAAVELFGVRRQWLDGVDKQIYDTHCFYKNLNEFSPFLNELKTKSVIGGALYVPDINVGRDTYCLLVIEEQVGDISDRPIFRYHICSYWIFSYWKCRAYIAACVAMAWEKKIYVHGQMLSLNDMKGLSEGGQFIGACDWHGGLPRLGSRWDSEDMADNPKVYLDGVDEGLIGKEKALEKWLELEAQGFMRSGFGEPPREAFQNALNEVKHFSGLGFIDKFLYRKRARKSGDNLFILD